MTYAAPGWGHIPKFLICVQVEQYNRLGIFRGCDYEDRTETLRYESEIIA